jgi:hypothetical protein
MCLNKKDLWLYLYKYLSVRRYSMLMVLIVHRANGFPDFVLIRARGAQAG